MDQQQPRQTVVLPARIVAPLTALNRNPRQLAGLNRTGRAKGSRNRIHDEISTIARQYGPECIAGLVTIMRKAFMAPEIDADVVIRCTEILLNRGYGRPPQALSLSGPDGGPIDFRNLDDDRLDQFIARLEANSTIEGEVVGGSESREGTT